LAGTTAIVASVILAAVTSETFQIFQSFICMTDLAVIKYLTTSINSTQVIIGKNVVPKDSIF